MNRLYDWGNKFHNLIVVGLQPGASRVLTESRILTCALRV